MQVPPLRYTAPPPQSQSARLSPTPTVTMRALELCVASFPGWGIRFHILKCTGERSRLEDQISHSEVAFQGSTGERPRLGDQISYSEVAF